MIKGEFINAVLHFLAAADRLDCRNPYFVRSKTAELCRGPLFDHHRDSWADENVEANVESTRIHQHENGSSVPVLNRV